jgi:hypothetical protein
MARQKRVYCYTKHELTKKYVDFHNEIGIIMELFYRKERAADLTEKFMMLKRGLYFGLDKMKDHIKKDRLIRANEYLSVLRDGIDDLRDITWQASGTYIYGK